MASSSRVAGVFDLGDGEHFVVAEWFPDPREIEIEMLKMASRFDDWAVPLQAAREVMIESTRIHFETESDPYGDKWQPLDEDYRKSKVDRGKPDRILVLEGDLERAATSEQAWFVSQDAIFFDTSVLPPYGPIHQEGTTEGEKAAKLQASIEKPVSQFTQQDFENISKGGHGLNIPQRMFVGAGVDDIAEIEEIFLQHMNRTIEEPWRTIGGGGVITGPKIGDMGTFKGGNFPIMGFTSKGQPILRTPAGPRFGRFI